MKIRQLFFVLCLIVCGTSVSPTAYASDAAEATEAAKDAINELLDDFDGFKDSEIFRRCVYGCGSENPGSAWRDKIKMLQRQTMPRKDVPTRLKDAIGELWQMGRTYARGNTRKATELLQRIEDALGK